MAGTHRDRIIAALKLSSQPLDDDELSRRTGISPRQAVNQACRALERAGQLRRVPGPGGKLVNVMHREQPERVVSRPAAVTRRPLQGNRSALATPIVDMPPGSSLEQRAAERVMLDRLAERLDTKLEPARLTVPSGVRVEVDGADKGRTVLVECWAHQGKPKGGQRQKVLTDALKLTWIASTLYPRPKLILCMSDPLAAAPFLPETRSWSGQALGDLGIRIEVVELPDDVRASIRAAQERQFR